MAADHPLIDRAGSAPGEQSTHDTLGVDGGR